MRYKDFNYKEGALRLFKLIGKNPEQVKIYTICLGVAKSGMSAIIKAFVIQENQIWLLGEGRVHGCGLDRGHECAYNIFAIAYPNLRYQDLLDQRWL